ncbi:MAG: hypothetical protein GDA40_05850 [Rhodobacteraceae bacterium]|nr:hypothetical protein [Paracoccaceae bacterium]
MQTTTHLLLAEMASVFRSENRAEAEATADLLIGFGAPDLGHRTRFPYAEAVKSLLASSDQPMAQVALEAFNVTPWGSIRAPVKGAKWRWRRLM